MAMTINTNVISINAQRNLGLSGNSLGTTMQRLSSGLRVNSAKDDAAGLAIAERMNAQARGLKVAARNANDGISLAQTAEGALGKMGDMLQRMRELAVQSSNATNSADDRKALQAEVSQLRSEIDRVAKTTSFNGRKILDGSFAGGVFQVGAGAGDNITVGNITNAKANALGKAEYGSNTTATIKASSITNLDAIDADVLQIQVGADAAISLGAIAQASSGQERLGQVVAAINAKTADTGVTAFLVAGDVEGDYTVELRSADAEKGVSLLGFTGATTGVGRAADVGMPAATRNAYDALQLKLTAALSATSANPTAVPTVAVADIKAIHAEVVAYAAMLTAGSGNPGASATTAANTFQTSMVSAALATEWVSGTASAPATTIANVNFWRNGNNEGTVAGATPGTATSNSVISTALTTLQSTLSTAHANQQTLNLSNVTTAFNNLKSSSLTTFTANLTALEGAMSNAAVGLLPTGGTLGVTPLPTTNPTAADLQMALGQALSNTNILMESGFGISTSQVQDHAGLEDIDISTQSGSWTAIKHLDAAIDQVNAARADLGALQTRFEKSIENIDIMNENISAARGRIVDADFASETANLSRAQILQQAGTAMVAQANQLPQQVLSLLQ